MYMYRTAINAQVSAQFGGTVKNSYNKVAHGHEFDKQMLKHYQDLAQAKFILSPSGLGFDTYRLWESLILGSIPIVESNTGFDRTFAKLPVLVVRNYTDLTPQLLERAYPCFERHAADFHFEHLTQKYWLHLVDRAIRTGSIDHVIENHPPVNPFCNFMVS